MNIEQSAKANAKAVRERVMSPTKKLINPTHAAIELQRLSFSELKDENRRLKDRVRGLEMTLADFRARVLDQAAHICAMEGIEKTNVVRKKPVGDIVNEVLKKYPGVTWEDLISVRRTRVFIKPRHMAMTAVHEQRPDLSFPAIGRIFGGRDHTTILHAVRKTQAERRISA
jgi:chromosomal replication initiation ATPase DnaA